EKRDDARANIAALIEGLIKLEVKSNAILEEIGQLYFFLGNYAESIRYLKKAAYQEMQQQGIKKTSQSAIQLINQLGIVYTQPMLADITTTHAFYNSYGEDGDRYKEELFARFEDKKKQRLKEIRDRL